MFKQNIIPRYRGFNLLGMFCTKESSVNKGRAPGYFIEDDFKMMAEWGFDFARLPLSYRVWSSVENPFLIDEERLKPLDMALEYAEKYNIHITMNMHRVPGYCVNNDEPVPEPFSLWNNDKEAYEALEFQWKTLAERYKHVPSSRLDFDLINEPQYTVPNARQAVIQHRLTKAIRSISPDRTITINGTHTGQMLPTDSLHIGDENIVYSLRGYAPASLTHYGVRGTTEGTPIPTWPNSKQVIGCANINWDRAKMDQYHDMWAAASNVYNRGIICNELGCFNKTPHDVVLAWYEDEMASLKERNIGYAVWNLSGKFGILDSEREDVDYVDHNGHKLDKKLLELLQRY